MKEQQQLTATSVWDNPSSKYGVGKDGVSRVWNYSQTRT